MVVMMRRNDPMIVMTRPNDPMVVMTRPNDPMVVMTRRNDPMVVMTSHNDPMVVMAHRVRAGWKRGMSTQEGVQPEGHRSTSRPWRKMGVWGYHWVCAVAGGSRFTRTAAEKCAVRGANGGMLFRGDPRAVLVNAQVQAHSDAPSDLLLRWYGLRSDLCSRRPRPKASKPKRVN